MENDFGFQLKQLRKMAGYTQAVASHKLQEKYPTMKISQTNLSTLESRALPPRATVLNKLAEFYSVPLSYFYNDKPSSGLLKREWALIRLLRRGERIAAIKLIVNLWESEGDG